MTLISKSTYPHGTQSRADLDFNWMEPYRPGEYAILPIELISRVAACLGYCDITLGDLTIDGEDGPIIIPDGVVTAITPHEVPPPPEPDPDYITEAEAIALLFGGSVDA